MHPVLAPLSTAEPQHLDVSSEERLSLRRGAVYRLDFDERTEGDIEDLERILRERDGDIEPRPAKFSKN